VRGDTSRAGESGGGVSNTVVWFLGCVFSAAVSGLFWMFARRAGDRGLSRASAVAVVVFCAAAFYFGSRL
jgi:hypothetical protein